MGGGVPTPIRRTEAAIWQPADRTVAPRRRGNAAAAIAGTKRHPRGAALERLDPRGAAARDPERGGADVLGRDLAPRQAVDRYPRRADAGPAAALEAAIRRVAQEAGRGRGGAQGR